MRVLETFLDAMGNTPLVRLTKATAGHSYSYPYVMLTYVFIGETPAIGTRQGR